jgi:hypothetical protein
MAAAVLFHQNFQVVSELLRQDLVSWAVEVEDASYELLQRLQHYLMLVMLVLLAARSIQRSS